MHPGETDINNIIYGAHAIIYSKNAEADRAFLGEVLGLAHVDASEGWLIFGLPPTELAIHPADKNDVHEFFFMVKDIQVFMQTMAERGVPCEPIQSTNWGELTRIKLPGGGKVGVYEPRHARPKETRPLRAASSRRHLK